MWGVIIAVAVFPLFSKLKSALGERNKLTTSVYIVIALGVLSFGGQFHDIGLWQYRDDGESPFTGCLGGIKRCADARPEHGRVIRGAQWINVKGLG